MTGENTTFLDQVYDLDDADSTKSLYDECADQYDRELREIGYASPARCAAALADAVADPSAPLHDLGCGTGLSGEAFREAGFTNIDGSDFSRPMLEIAESKKGVYQQLMVADLYHPLPFDDEAYANIAAVGVFSPGHAPPEMIDDVIAKLPIGGCFVFTLNDHALEMPGYRQHVDNLESNGRIEKVFDEYGEHLRRDGLKSQVCVVRRSG